jgi:glycine oxidase
MPTAGDNRVMALGTAIWRDQLVADELAQLRRGAGVIADPRPDVLVVGGGIVGAATAAACHQARVGSVLLIETGELGSGATGGAAGLLLPEVHAWSDRQPFVDLARSSLELWRELEQALPGGVGLTDLDWIGTPPDHEGSSPSPAAAVLIRHQARVNPLRALARMAAAVPSISTYTPASSVTVKGSRLVTVSTAAGDIHPGVVVFATGMPPALGGLAVSLPGSRVKGHLLVTEPSPVRLPGTVAQVATQLEDGRLLAGGTLDFGDEGRAVRRDVIASILAELYAHLPEVTGLRAAYQWCCFRPWHPDGYPVIDRIRGLDNAWLTSGHFRTGILMAPVTAQMLTHWISTGRPPPRAVAWNSARLTEDRLGRPRRSPAAGRPHGSGSRDSRDDGHNTSTRTTGGTGERTDQPRSQILEPPPPGRS